MALEIVDFLFTLYPSSNFRSKELGGIREVLALSRRPSGVEGRAAL